MSIRHFFSGFFVIALALVGFRLGCSDYATLLVPSQGHIVWESQGLVSEYIIEPQTCIYGERKILLQLRSRNRCGCSVERPVEIKECLRTINMGDITWKTQREPCVLIPHPDCE